MHEGYTIRDQSAIHFLTFSVVDWVDIFSRKSHRDVIIDSLNHCVKKKSALIYGFVIMTNHMHLIMQSGTGHLSDLIRDFKKWTSVTLLDAVRHEPESRREWMLHRFAWNAAGRSTNTNYQIWTHENHPMEVWSYQFFLQKLNYIHQNPLRAGWVEREEDYVYSSAAYFNGGRCLVPITDWPL